MMRLVALLCVAGLTGDAFGQTCKNQVVPCNYAFLYNGSFSWSSTLTGPKSSYTETVTATIVNGVATCNGRAIMSGDGRARNGTVTGAGLIGVEFDRPDPDEIKEPGPLKDATLVYRVTVACASPYFPAAGDDAPEIPSRPAELGDYFQETYHQRATEQAMPLLQGTNSYPSPDSDALNGVTGAVRVSWRLERKP